MTLSVGQYRALEMVKDKPFYGYGGKWRSSFEKLTALGLVLHEFDLCRIPNDCWTITEDGRYALETPIRITPAAQEVLEWVAEFQDAECINGGRFTGSSWGVIYWLERGPKFIELSRWNGNEVQAKITARGEEYMCHFAWGRAALARRQ